MQTGFRSRVPSGLGALVMAFLLVVPGLGAQQGGTVTGRVVDAQGAQPIPAAQVFIANLELGGLTQQNGRYLLQNVPAGTHTVSVSRIGYRTTEVQVTVGGGQTVEQNFTMNEEALQLDEIIVTGTAGGTQRRAIGNVVTTVDVGAISDMVAVSSVQDVLTGRTPGLAFAQVSGQLGAGSSITIRGASSFALNTQPLIYVDGVRVNNQTRAGPQLADDRGVFENDTGTGSVSVLDDFNAEDIESIEIIKGPAAATLYGTEASAGVIQIITKRGTQGAPQFSVSQKVGYNYMAEPAGKLGTNYACTTVRNRPCASEADVFGYNMYEEATRQIAAGLFPWPTENIFQNGLSLATNVDVRGGTDNIRYFVSANYENEEGPVWFNTDDTYRFRANIGVVLSPSVSLDVSTNYVDGATRFAAQVQRDGGVWADMMAADGFCLDRIAASDCRLIGFQEHLPSEVADIESTRDYNRFTGSLALNHNIGTWFDQRLIVGLDRGLDLNNVLFPLDLVDPAYQETRVGKIEIDRNYSTLYSVDYAATGRYNPYESVSLATSAGVQYYVNQYDAYGSIGSGFPVPESRTINQTPTASTPTTYEFRDDRSLGFYVQEVVGWNDRLFVTAAVRFDDNSTFGAETDFEVYPKFSATWLLSEESFWNVDLLNSFRMRGAWGKAGRQPDTFASRKLFRVIPGPGGTASITASSPGNPLVGPETSTEIEVGADVALMDDRISAEFTYFNQKTEDAILPQGVMPSLGINTATSSAVPENVARIDNWGWEASLTARIYESSAFSFELTLIGDHLKNEIKVIGETPSSSSLRVGLPYPATVKNYLVVSAEFDAAGNVVNAMCDAGVLIGDPTLDDADRGRIAGGELYPCPNRSAPRGNILLGPRNPTYTWSVAPTFSFLNNNLQVFALAQGQYGAWGSVDHFALRGVFKTSYQSRVRDDVFWVANSNLSGATQGELRYVDTDFWKLREVGFRYSLPQQWADRIGADRASFAFSGRNMWTIWVDTKFSPQGNRIADPELNSFAGAGHGFAGHKMPAMASAHLTLRLTF